MNDEFNRCKIKDVAQIVGGGTPSTENINYWNGDVAWITPKDLSNHKYRFVKTGERNISKNGLKNSSAKLLPKHAILFSSRAPIGYIAIAENELTTNQGFRSLICDNTKVDYLFIYYLLKFNKSDLESKASGSTFKELSGTAFGNFEINLPSLSEQKAIAKILSDLDSKIELNQQMNNTLEEIGKTLFKRWFVDFEFPNEEGKPYKLSGGEMVYNEELKKEIPKGWEIDHLGNVVDLNWGDMNTTKMSYIDIGFPTYSASGLDGQMNHYDYDSKGIILGAIGANCGKTWFANGKWSCIKNTIRIIPKEQQVIEYIYFLSNDNSFWPKRGSAQPFVSQTDARNISIIVPEEKVLSVFIKQSSYLLDKIRQNELENIELLKIRNLLLPKLMSGKIRVKC